MKPDADRELDAELRRTAAVEIARRLAADPELRWAYDEAAQIAQHGVARPPRLAAFGALGRLGWIAATIAFAAAVSFWALRIPDQPGVERPGATSRAAAIVAGSAAANPVVMLQGLVAVDANSVAVLPFKTSGATSADERTDLPSELGVALQSSIVAQLSAVPGLYVIGGAAVQPYADAALSPAEIGLLLGARGIMSGRVEHVAGRVHVQAELSDAASNSVIWRVEYERPIDELRAIQIDLADGVAGALVDPALRAGALAAGSARVDNTLTAITEPTFNQ